MADQKIESLYKAQYETLVKAMRAKDATITNLQNMLDEKQEKLNELVAFENVLSSFQQFFALVIKPNLNKRG